MLPRVSKQEDMAMLYCGPLKTSLRRFGLTDSQIDNFFDVHSDAMRSRAEEILPFDDVLLVLSECEAGSCSIVTSSYSSAVQTILQKSCHLNESIFYKVLGRELKQSKAKKCQTILEELCLMPSSVLHFGDMVSDLLYSREVGIPFCAVGWGYHPIQYLNAFNPDFSVGLPKNLGHLLKRRPMMLPANQQA